MEEKSIPSISMDIQEGPVCICQCANPSLRGNSTCNANSTMTTPGLKDTLNIVVRKIILPCCNHAEKLTKFAKAVIASTGHVSVNNTSILSNKRKRKASVEIKEKESQPSSKRIQLTCYKSELQPQSSSEAPYLPTEDEISTGCTAESSPDSLCIEFDLGTPSTSSSLGSPSQCQSISCGSFNSWQLNAAMSSQSKNFSGQCACNLNTAISGFRPCPLPALSWANASDVWTLMCHKDEVAAHGRKSSMLENHPGLQPRMRAILLDWLIEVCEVYKLHRETYYLAIDYLDRYLSTQKKVQKTHLQLIGITCLFVAAKVEEIYPPKIGEFAYVTDGACQEEDILQHELLLLKALDWSISPVTIMGWLGVYMQLNVSNRTASSLSVNRYAEKMGDENSTNCSPKYTSLLLNHQKGNLNFPNTNKAAGSLCDSEIPAGKSYESIANDTDVCWKRDKLEDDTFIYPQFSGLEFAQTAQLIDLCSLDLGIANFPYSVVAASAMSYSFNRSIALQVSGLEWNTISPCAQWMEPFYHVVTEESQNLFLLEQNEQIKSKFGLGHLCPNIATDDSYIIQTHSITMEMFDKAVLRREQYKTSTKLTDQEFSPAVDNICPEGILTPPASSRKPPEEVIVLSEQNKTLQGS